MLHIPCLVTIWPVCVTPFKSFLINLFPFTNLFCCSSSFSCLSLTMKWPMLESVPDVIVFQPVAITSLPHAVMFLYRQCKIVLALFWCVCTSHCNLMFSVLLGSGFKNLFYCFSGFSLQIGLCMFIFLACTTKRTYTHTPFHLYRLTLANLS